MRKKKQRVSSVQKTQRLLLILRAAFERSGVRLQDPLLLGFSGGVDSLALALCVKALDVPAVLAHLDHGVRPESAVQVDAVRDLAARVGLPLVTRTVDVFAQSREQGIGLEEAGRKARYAFFEQARRELAAHEGNGQGRAWLVLGHQADDLAEDVLLRLVRGAGWPALGGMCECDPARWLVRPLLHVPRAELAALVAASGLEPVDDSSNSSLDFRRNRLRHTVLPLLQAENPSLLQAMRRLHEQARLDEDFWEVQMTPVLDQVCCAEGRVSVPETVLKALHPALRMRVYRRLLTLVPHAGQARADSLSALDRALLEPQRPKLFQLPGRTQARLADGRLVVFRTESTIT